MSTPRPASPPDEAEQAVARVLEAERSAREAVAECERRAERSVADAKARVAELHERTGARIERLRERMALGAERRLSALILLTPRRALPQPAPAEAQGGSPWVLDQLARGARSLPPAVRAALARLENMPLGNRIRRGDVRLEGWTFRPGLDELLAHIARFLYY